MAKNSASLGGHYFAKQTTTGERSGEELQGRGGDPLQGGQETTSKESGTGACSGAQGGGPVQGISGQWTRGEERSLLRQRGGGGTPRVISGAQLRQERE